MVKGKCNNIILCGLIFLVLTVVGLYSIILGIKVQFGSALVYDNWMAMVYYLVGIFLISGIKMHMYKVHMK